MLRDVFGASNSGWREYSDSFHISHKKARIFENIFLAKSSSELVSNDSYLIQISIT
jgi:hypothetical protein